MCEALQKLVPLIVGSDLNAVLCLHGRCSNELNSNVFGIYRQADELHTTVRSSLAGSTKETGASGK